MPCYEASCPYLCTSGSYHSLCMFVCCLMPSLSSFSKAPGQVVSLRSPERPMKLHLVVPERVDNKYRLLGRMEHTGKTLLFELALAKLFSGCASHRNAPAAELKHPVDLRGRIFSKFCPGHSIRRASRSAASGRAASVFLRTEQISDERVQSPLVRRSETASRVLYLAPTRQTSQNAYSQ